MFYPAQLASCLNVNYVVNSCYLSKLLLLTQGKLSIDTNLGLAKTTQQTLLLHI